MAATAPAAVRELVRSQLTEWGVATSLDDACLIASELVNNALLHARSDVTVTLSSSDRGVRVAVADSSVALPSPGRPTPTSCSGRGLRIIDSLAVRWGYDLQSSGKVVWAEFAC
jgi:two-component sensor histidine kinase